jgi:hypothetical protein
MGVFGLRHFLENFDLGLDVGSVLFVLPTSSVQGALCLVDGVLPPLAFLLPFLRAFALMALLLLLESERGLSVGRVVGGLLRMLLRLAAQRLAGSGLLRSALANEIGRQFGVLLEGSAAPSKLFKSICNADSFNRARLARSPAAWFATWSM